jgi:hypothetical protein
MRRRMSGNNLRDTIEVGDRGEGRGWDWEIVSASFVLSMEFVDMGLSVE